MQPLWVAVLAPCAQAHDPSTTELWLSTAPRGVWQLDARLDAADFSASPTPDDAYRFLSAHVSLDWGGAVSDAGGAAQDLRLTHTGAGLWAHTGGTYLHTARTLTVQSTPDTGTVLVHLRGEDGGAPQTLRLLPGTTSAPFELNSSAHAATSAVVTTYVYQGVIHILPLGVDHVAFVLALFFLTPRTRPLVLQLSAFTAAHTVSLGLAVLGYIALPGRVVEAAIAASILWIALQNLRSDETRGHRLAVVFGFGLLHGMGFASALQELGLPARELVAALLSFNVGVELGQLAVVGAAIAVVGPWRQEPWYRARVSRPASAVLAALGAMWLVQRVLL